MTRASFRFCALSSTIRMRSAIVSTGRAVARENGGESATQTRRASNVDATAVCLGDAFGQSETEPRALVALGCARIQLLKLDEQPGDVLRRNADPGIADVDAKMVLTFGIDADSHGSLLRRELDGVGEIVVEDLLDARRVDHHGSYVRDHGFEP